MKSSLPAATKAEKKRIGIIKRDVGCIACYLDSGMFETPADAHHIISDISGNRMGHKYTIPLCPEKHHKYGKMSIHGGAKLFVKTYGTELELLELTNEWAEVFK